MMMTNNLNGCTWKATRYAGGTTEKLIAAAGSMKQYRAFENIWAVYWPIYFEAITGLELYFEGIWKYLGCIYGLYIWKQYRASEYIRKSFGKFSVIYRPIYWEAISGQQIYLEVLWKYLGYNLPIYLEAISGFGIYLKVLWKYLGYNLPIYLEAISGLGIYFKILWIYIWSFLETISGLGLYLVMISALWKYLVYRLSYMPGSFIRPTKIFCLHIFLVYIFGTMDKFAPLEWSPAWPCTRPRHPSFPPLCSLLSGGLFWFARIISS